MHYDFHSSNYYWEFTSSEVPLHHTRYTAMPPSGVGPSWIEDRGPWGCFHPSPCGHYRSSSLFPYFFSSSCCCWKDLGVARCLSFVQHYSWDLHLCVLQWIGWLQWYPMEADFWPRGPDYPKSMGCLHRVSQDPAAPHIFLSSSVQQASWVPPQLPDGGALSLSAWSQLGQPVLGDAWSPFSALGRFICLFWGCGLQGSVPSQWVCPPWIPGYASWLPLASYSPQVPPFYWPEDYPSSLLPFSRSVFTSSLWSALITACSDSLPVSRLSVGLSAEPIPRGRAP